MSISNSERQNQRELCRGSRAVTDLGGDGLQTVHESAPAPRPRRQRMKYGLTSYGDMFYSSSRL